MTLIEINNLKDFNDVHASHKDKLVIIDFTATWCGPCRMISPIFKKLAEEYAGKAVFCKCDVDAAQPVAQQEKINAMPSFIFYVNGKRVDEIVGADSSLLTSKIQKLVSQHSVFSSKGHSLLSGSFSTSSSSKSADRAPPKRVNPWADPNFVPPGMRQTAAAGVAKKDAEKPVTSTDKGHHGPKTPWSNPSFLPKPTESTPTSAPSDPKPKETKEDAELARAIAMSLDVQKPESELQNDPNLVSRISQNLVAELVDMGFPRLRAEKALILTNGKTLEVATNWLIEHEQDADVDEPLTVVNAPPADASKSGEMIDDDEDDGLSEAIRSVREKAAKAKEEARQLALQGQESVDMSKMTKEEKIAYLERLKSVRKTQREKQEREEAKQKEIDRQQNVKAALEAKRAREEQQAAMAAARAKREKEAERARQKRIEDKLRLEKEARAKARLEREKQKAQASNNPK